MQAKHAYPLTWHDRIRLTVAVAALALGLTALVGSVASARQAVDQPVCFLVCTHRG
ncbi:MAG: hypothetical protein ACRDJU_03285 [Actinomycetota bacterium]